MTDGYQILILWENGLEFFWKRRKKKDKKFLKKQKRMEFDQFEVKLKFLKNISLSKIYQSSMKHLRDTKTTKIVKI
jgi:hypothetical protein